MAYLNHLHQQQPYHHPHHGNPFPQQQQQYHHHQQQQQHMMSGMQPLPLNGGGGMTMDTDEDRMEAAAANEILDSDSRHEMLLPIDFLPCPNTVIVGRGKKVAQHAGNVRFRELVKNELTEYSAATTKAHKSSIIVRVLTEIRNKSHYAFVKQNLTTHRWYRVEETAQRITTAQAFRDALKDNYKSSRAFKKLKREEEKKVKNDEKEKEGGGEEKPAKKKKERKKKAAAAKESEPAPAPAPAAATKEPTPAPAPPVPAAAPAPADAVKKEEPVVPEEEATATPPNSNKKKVAQPTQLNDAAMKDLRGMLDDAQASIMTGNFSWWDPKAVNSSAKGDKKMPSLMPPPTSRGAGGGGAINPNSVSSCSSLMWSNHSMISSKHSTFRDPFMDTSHRPYARSGGGKSSDMDTSTRGGKPRGKSSDMDTSTRGGGKPRYKDPWMDSSRGGGGIKYSNHSIRTLSNHSIMTISGHSTRSNSTFNGLLAKYGGTSNEMMRAGDNPFAPRPIAIAVQEDGDDGGAMDMDLDDVLTSTAAMKVSSGDDIADQQPQKLYNVKSSNYGGGGPIDDGLGLGSLSDHSLMSSMSSIHSVKFVADDIFTDGLSMHGSSRHQYPPYHHYNNNGNGSSNNNNNNGNNNGKSSSCPQTSDRYRNSAFPMSA